MFLFLAATIAVATPADLPAAIARAKPGDVLQLAPGSYGALVLNNPEFTLRSADPKRPALISRITVNNARNFTMSGLEFSYVPAPGEQNFQVMIRINGGSNVTLDGLYVHGVVDGDVRQDGHGVWAVGVDGFTVSNSRFMEINSGIKAEQSRRVRITGNDIGWIGSDAIDIPGSNGVLIDWNRVHDFRTNDGMHPDFVQCWTTRQKSGCKNVRIIRNEVQGAPGHEAQGVFFGDEDGVGGYENIEISYNLFSQTWWHAINIYGGPKNVTIRYNRVVAGVSYPTPWIRVDAPAVVEGNVAPAFFINSRVNVAPPGNEIGGTLPR